MADESIDETFRTGARILLPTYPQPEHILELIAVDATSLSIVAAQSLADAAKLFRELDVSGQGSAETRKSIRYVRRHFPEPSIALALGRSNSIKDWLLPEDYDWSGNSS